MELGLSQDGKPVITQEMIDEMKANVDNINYDVARAREAQVRHDVMSMCTLSVSSVQRRRGSSISPLIPLI